MNGAETRTTTTPHFTSVMSSGSAVDQVVSDTPHPGGCVRVESERFSGGEATGVCRLNEGSPSSSDSIVTAQLDDETRAMITALATVSGHIPRVVTMLAQDQLPVEKEREFASLLMSLGDLLNEHAESATRMRTVHRQPARLR